MKEGHAASDAAAATAVTTTGPGLPEVYGRRKRSRMPESGSRKRYIQKKMVERRILLYVLMSNMNVEPRSPRQPGLVVERRTLLLMSNVNVAPRSPLTWQPCLVLNPHSCSVGNYRFRSPGTSPLESKGTDGKKI